MTGSPHEGPALRARTARNVFLGSARRVLSRPLSVSHNLAPPYGLCSELWNKPAAIIGRQPWRRRAFGAQRFASAEPNRGLEESCCWIS